MSLQGNPLRKGVALTLPAQDRRAALRHALRPDRACRLTVSTARESLWAQVLDISATGIGLLLPGPVAPGSVLLIELRFKAEPVPVALVAEVTHLRPLPDGSWAAGCYFDNLRGDLTLAERQQLQALLLRRDQDLAEPNAELKEIPAVLAHRLHNPLASVRNAFRVMHLRRGKRPATEVEEWQGRHLGRRMEDFFDLFRLGHGSLRLRKEALDVGELIARAREAVQPFLEARKHRLTLVLPRAPLRLEGDRPRLERVLGNLLEGAIKYSAPGGEIRLAATREGDQIVLRILDTGSGMAVVKWRRILDTSPPADLAQGEPEAGLALARRLLEFHGGSVAARTSEAGQGSEVIVRLPALAGRPEHRAASAGPDG
jgi:signal transduction histidine kinase